jgi:hypothetical protein
MPLSWLPRSSLNDEACSFTFVGDWNRQCDCCRRRDWGSEGCFVRRLDARGAFAAYGLSPRLRGLPPDHFLKAR